MSEASEHLAERIRTILGDRYVTREQKMFGGRAFMLHGNMLVGLMKDASLLVRVGKENHDEALARPGARPMSMGERTMHGFIQVDPDAIEDDEDLTGWIDFALAYVITLPAK